MTVFLCKKCRDDFVEKYDGPGEALTIGCLGIRKCEICEQDVNCAEEKWYVFRKSDMARAWYNKIRKNNNPGAVIKIPEVIRAEAIALVTLLPGSVITKCEEVDGVVKGSAKFTETGMTHGPVRFEDESPEMSLLRSDDGNPPQSRAHGAMGRGSDILRKAAGLKYDEELTVPKPWVKWFWKIKVPQWMMWKVKFSIDSYWKSWCRKSNEIFIIYIGSRISFSADFEKLRGYFFDITVFNFMFKLSIIKSIGLGYGIEREDIKIIIPNDDKRLTPSVKGWIN